MMRAENRARQSERMKALNADPEFRAKMKTVNSERMKALHADPEFRAKASERMKALHADPEFRAKCGHLSSDEIALIVEQVANAPALCGNCK